LRQGDQELLGLQFSRMIESALPVNGLADWVAVAGIVAWAASEAGARIGWGLGLGLSFGCRVWHVVKMSQFWVKVKVKG
jgi:hypothetical protein